MLRRLSERECKGVHASKPRLDIDTLCICILALCSSDVRTGEALLAQQAVVPVVPTVEKWEQATGSEDTAAVRGGAGVIGVTYSCQIGKLILNSAIFLH